MLFVRFALFSLCVFIAGCSTTPTPTPPAVTQQQPLQPRAALIKLSEDQFPDFADDASTASLRTAALQSLAYYRTRPPSEAYTLSVDTYTATEFAGSLAFFVDLIDQSASTEAFKAAVRKHFQVYQSIGTDAKQTVTFSSYYEPTIPARLKRTATYKYPIYGRPPDLIDVDLGQFDPIYQGARIAGRREGQKLVPYFTRAQIDTEHILRKKAPILAWAKTPTDIFFLQIEGSGWLDLGNRRIRIRYDGTNGRKYRSAGLYLISLGKVPNKISHDSFEHWLNTHPEERQSILNHNERYVFFRLDDGRSGSFAYGNIDVPLTPGRSIATDPKLFPKGMLAWISTDRPELTPEGKETGTVLPLKRFMLNQDEGGAIQGPGRVDFFAGDGQEAHNFATHFWQKGTLYFLVKKRGD